ncbi:MULTISPECIES: S8 family serine peptidase [unclassified Streptomyces]|uniref:S8 family serine peptidase n=1 Tax=unclassified Streptomyces TaxID=2593676 RepID=UPI000709A94D|nr:S8 family serine peptidase [Streptomyces sp. Root264]KRD17984.1 hypothetical protein ASE41_21020 [Streptomyces sp. Root264]
MLAACAVLSAIAATAAVTGPAQAAEPAPAQRWIVQLKDTVTDPGKVAEEQTKGLARDGRSRLRHVYNAAADGLVLKGYALEATAEQIASIRADPQVAAVERDEQGSVPEPVAGPAPKPPQQRTGRPGQGGVLHAGDPLLAGQWGLFRIGAVAGGERGFTLPSPARVGVAVLDTGIDVNHPDLRVAGSVNFSGAATADDFYGHGTHVAGIVQALNNSVGAEGAAPGTRLWNVKVIKDDGSLLNSDLIAGLNWLVQNAKAHNIRVANLSLRTPDSLLLHQAIRLADRAGVTLVAAAGNDGTTAPNYPAAYPEAISVAATTVFNQKAGFSNHGASWVDIAAPGAGILSTLPTHPTPPGEDYGFEDGTSMATPFVSAATALCLTSGHCRGAVGDIRRTLGRDSLPIAGTGTEYRYGLVQVACYWQTALRCSRTNTAGKVS